jgi:phage head maturation protease
VDYNHKPAQLLGTQYAGTARFSVTDEGVMYDVEVPETTYANDMLALVDRGDIRGSSFVFIAARNGDKWTPEKRNGLDIYRRDITQIARIISMGPVFGEAYPDTTVAKRSLLEWEAEEARKAGQTMGEALRTLNVPKADGIVTPTGHDPRTVAAIFG